MLLFFYLKRFFSAYACAPLASNLSANQLQTLKLSLSLCLSVCLSVCLSLSLSYTHSYTHTRTHTHTHTHSHTRTHTRTHARTHAHTHTHAPISVSHLWHARAQNTMLIFSVVVFLSDDSVPPLTPVCFKSILWTNKRGQFTLFCILNLGSTQTGTNA